MSVLKKIGQRLFDALVSGLKSIALWLLKITGVIALAVLIYTYAPVLSRGPDQDHCSFGPVTNDQYRVYLAEARRRQAVERQSFTSDERDISSRLDSRLQEMLGSERSFYKQIAIVHAVMRAVGAGYLNVGGVPNFNPYQTERPIDELPLSYWIDINRLVWFQPLQKTLWIQVQMFDPSGRLPEVRQRNGNFKLVALYAGLKGPSPGFLISDGTNCPPVPDAETAARYEGSQ